MKKQAAKIKSTWTLAELKEALTDDDMQKLEAYQAKKAGERAKKQAAAKVARLEKELTQAKVAAR